MLAAITAVMMVLNVVAVGSFSTFLVQELLKPDIGSWEIDKKLGAAPHANLLEILRVLPL